MGLRNSARSWAELPVSSIRASAATVAERLVVKIEFLKQEAELGVPPPRPLGVQPIDFGRAEDLIEVAYTGSRQSLAAAATGTVRSQMARLGPNSHAARSRSREPSARSAGS